MSGEVQIYVGLLDEGVEVWRPVQTEHVYGNVYRILDQPYDREIEAWQFEPQPRGIPKALPGEVPRRAVG